MKNISLLACAMFAFSGCVSTHTNLPLVDFKSKIHTTKNDIDKSISFAMVEPKIRLVGYINPQLRDFILKRVVLELKDARRLLITEIEKTIINKGILVSNIYKDINDMTYSQKKHTTGVFIPYITIKLNEVGTSLMFLPDTIISTDSELSSKISIDLVAIEPLSNEKIWVKSLPKIKNKISLYYRPYMIGAYSSQPYSTTFFYNETVPMVKDIDSLILKAYNNTLDSVDKYVSLDEFRDLNVDIKKLKGSKRY